jgi:hypothetical protein
MEDKLNLYDFLGYLIPGTAVVLSIYLLLRDIQVITEPIEIGSLGDSLIVLIIGYFMGHVIQAFGHKIEQFYLKRWGGWESLKLLGQDDKTYTATLKGKILAAAQDVFGVEVDPEKPEKEQRRQKQDLFNLCYSLVIQKGVAPHTPIFHGIYALYRGIVATIYLGVVLCVVSVAWPLVVTREIQTQELMLLLLWPRLIIVGALGWGLRLILKRMKDFSKHFASSVYRYFIVWYDTRTDKTAATKPS